MVLSDLGAAVDDGMIVVLVDNFDVLVEVGIDAVVVSIVVTLSLQAALVINMKMTKLAMPLIFNQRQCYTSGSS